MCGTHVEQEIIPGLANKAGKFTKVVYQYLKSWLIKTMLRHSFLVCLFTHQTSKISYI